MEKIRIPNLHHSQFSDEHRAEQNVLAFKGYPYALKQLSFYWKICQFIRNLQAARNNFDKHFFFRAQLSASMNSSFIHSQFHQIFKG